MNYDAIIAVSSIVAFCTFSVWYLETFFRDATEEELNP